MNSFGLGLILNFVDNASAGMNTATANFNRMSATADSMTSSVSASATEMASIAFSLSAVGDTFVSIGESITGVFTGITQQVIDSGMQLQGYRMQLNALYGSAEAGEAKMEEIKQYAMKSVFEIESLIPAVTMMKAVGIEAMQDITTSSGEHTQKLLDYASDLAAMMPNMRNVYGTGVSAAMGAFKEYIAEGNALSLKRGAGLDITAMLGEDKGKTIEERTQQIADLIDQLNIVGYTVKLQDTPTQRLSNLQDALYNTLTKISDSGVFETYCGLLEKLSDWLFSLVDNEETFNLITGVLADTITTILSPLESMLDWVIENSNAIIDWVKEHPKLTKNILVTVAALGAFLIVGGSVLKMLSSIAFAMSGFQMLKSLPSLLGLVGTSFKSLITKAFPFVTLASLVYFAWKNNIFGVRDVVTNAMKDIGNIISLVSDAWSDNTLSEEKFLQAKELGILPFISSLLQLKYYWSYFVDGFKEGFKSFFEGIAESLSWLNLMGIDVNSIVAGFGEFLSSLVGVGAEDKWRAVGEVVGNITSALITLYVLSNVLKPIISILSLIGKVAGVVGKSFKFIWNIGKILFNPVLKVAGGVIGFFKDLGAAISLMKQGFGFLEVMGAWFPKTAKVLTFIGKIFTTIGKFFTTTLGGITTLVTGIVLAVTGFVKQLKDGFSWFWEIIKWIGIALSVVGAILLGVSALPAVIIGAIVGAITTIIVLLKDNWTAVCNFFSKIGSWIYDNVIKPVADFFVGLWNGIVKGVKAIGSFFSSIGSWIYNNVIQPIVDFFVSLWEGLVAGVKAVGKFFSTIATWVYNNIIQPIVSFFTDIIFPIISKIIEIVAKVIEIVVVLFTQIVKQIYIGVIKPLINFFVELWGKIVSIFKSVVSSIVNFFTQLWSDIVRIFNSIVSGIKKIFTTVVNWVNTNIIQPIVSFFTSLWNSIVSIVTSIVEGIKSVFFTVVDWISTNIITPITKFFTGLWEGIVNGVTVFIETVKNVFLTIVDWISENIITPISNFFSFLWEGIKTAFDVVVETVSSAIKGAINTVLGFVCNVINGVIKAINLAIGVINEIPGVSITKIELLELPKLATGGVVDKPTTAIIGEAGAEAVVPLKNNTEWITGVSSLIVPALVKELSKLSSAVTATKSPAPINNDQKFLTSNHNALYEGNKTTTEESHIDNSVTFEAGSIVIQLSNTSDSELEKVADKLMKIIARKQQLKAMAVRA